MRYLTDIQKMKRKSGFANGLRPFVGIGVDQDATQRKTFYKNCGSYARKIKKFQEILPFLPDFFGQLLWDRLAGLVDEVTVIFSGKRPRAFASVSSA